MSKAPKIRRSRRLNPTALAILGATVVVLSIGFFVLQRYRSSAAGSGYLTEAKARIEQKQWNLALGYLNRYLELHPDDPEASA